MGCQLSVELEEKTVLSVAGNTRRRGEAYAKEECLNPRRVITTTVKTDDGLIVLVKTDKSVVKEKMFACMAFVKTLRPTGTRFLCGGFDL